ncbi:MAG: aspartate kinase [Nitrososphaerota archaeon]|nr:aspartate kinase [Nitrososphaerales archaeon]MDW8044172.1 aspartate kinase [Nitrososphaerota archaeon]
MGDIVVIKFGGSVLSNEKMIERAANAVKDGVEKGLRMVIVISALKGVTDSLINLAKKVNPNTPKDLMDEILSMGERTSARLFANALIAKGLDPVIVDPSLENWPIITDENFTDANPDYNETSNLVKEKLIPMLEAGKIPVVCGFLGKSKSGKITTLGRGGSDTTAILLGSCLDAKEVVLVKDVDTVFSSDPDLVENPIPITQLDAEEAYALTLGGAKFLHPKALAYKRANVRLRIASLTNGSLGGTVIDGGAIELKIERMNEPITMVTIIGSEASEPESIRLLVEEVKRAGGSLVAMSSEPKSIILYVAGGENVPNRLHNTMVTRGLGKALSAFGDLAMITVRGPAIETVPGMVQRVTQPLAREGINIFGVVTISSSIKLFIKREESDKVMSMLRSALMVVGA